MKNPVPDLYSLELLRVLRTAHGSIADQEVAAMYAGQMNMTTTDGEIRCQMVVQIICLLSVATLFC
ncbi:hypothetical protein [Pseudomonas capeferrum]